MSELVENDTSLAYYRTIWILAVILGENCARSYARLLINWMSAADLSHFQYQCGVSYGYIISKSVQNRTKLAAVKVLHTINAK